MMAPSMPVAVVVVVVVDVVMKPSEGVVRVVTTVVESVRFFAPEEVEVARASVDVVTAVLAVVVTKGLNEVVDMMETAADARVVVAANALGTVDVTNGLKVVETAFVRGTSVPVDVVVPANFVADVLGVVVRAAAATAVVVTNGLNVVLLCTLCAKGCHIANRIR